MIVLKREEDCGVVGKEEGVGREMEKKKVGLSSAGCFVIILRAVRQSRQCV